MKAGVLSQMAERRSPRVRDHLAENETDIGLEIAYSGLGRHFHCFLLPHLFQPTNSIP